jgi:Ca2+/H+ antiporter
MQYKMSQKNKKISLTLMVSYALAQILLQIPDLTTISRTCELHSFTNYGFIAQNSHQ